MNSFEPPKRRALSESELYKVLEKLPTDQVGVQKAQVVLERQAALREQDNVALETWIHQMKALGTKEAADAVSLALGLIPAQNFVQDSDSTPLESQLLTSPIETVGTRRMRRESERTKFSMATTFVAWSVFAGVYAVVVWILGFSLTDSLVGLALGLVISGLAKASLLTHKDSAVLRSAAAYGANGFRFFAVVAWFAILLWGGFYFPELSMPVEFSALLSNIFVSKVVWLIPIVCVVLIFGVIGTFIGSRFIGAVFIGPVLITIALAIYSLQPFAGSISFIYPTLVGSIETTLLVAVLSAAVTVLLRPHTKANTPEVLLGHTLAFVVTSGFLILLFSVTIWVGWSYLLLLTCVGFAAGLLSVSIKEFFGKKLGPVVLLLLVLITAAVLVVLDGNQIRPYLDAFLIAHLTLVSIDSWLRTKPLHKASLTTPYGFYGGWSTSASLTVLVTMLTASPFVLDYLASFGLRLDYFLASFIVAIALSLSRVFIIRAQDKEVAKVETGPKDLNNLLGL